MIMSTRIRAPWGRYRASWPALLMGAALVATLSVSPTGTAHADTPFAPRIGSFLTAGAPIYTDPVDGWGCLLLDGCRGPGRQFSDPGPVARSDHAGAAVYLRCRLGAYYKITYLEADYRVGWTQVDNVRPWEDVRGCGPLDL